jgi:hypothetical protein
MRSRRASHGSAPPLNCDAMRVSSVIILFLGATALAACLPLPHRERVAPEVAGLLHDDKQPAAGLTVHYAHRKMWGGGTECTESDVVATTGSDGRFVFGEGKEFRFFVVMGDPVFAYEVCVERRGGRDLLWRMDDFGFVETPVELTCDLNAPVKDGERGRGRCSVRYPRWDKS